MSDLSSTASSTFQPLTPSSDDRRRTPGSPPPPPGAWRRWVAESAATLAAVLLIAGAAGSALTLMGFKIWGPPQEVAQIRVELRQKDSTLTVRVVKLEDGSARQLDELRDTRADIQTLFYLQCEGMRRTVRGAPSDCIDILRKRGH